ncbi:MAG: BCCT family transporter [Flavobacteriales bacterium AspAUS03]
MAWSPFVRTFIAGISKGDIIKKFILGFLLVLSLLTFLWMSAFGRIVLYQELNCNNLIKTDVNENIDTSI